MDVKKQKSELAPLSKIGKEKMQTRQKVWIGSYLFLLFIFIAAYFLLRLEVFNIFGKYRMTLQKVSLGGIFMILILTAAKFAEFIITSKSHTTSTRYNLIRLERLLAVLLIAVVFVSILFVNWYTAAVSLGLISLILGFALQTPISSFIGWVYIIIRAPYHVGDRIQVDTFTGDVVEINYLDTTLWEFAGDYLTNDLPSGRLIRFPNSLVFQYPVYNYSWKKFPFIWNEIPFHIAYGSDFEYVETTIREVTKNELGPEVAENIRRYKELLSETAVDELEIKEYPFICFRINANTWVEVLVVYLVNPKQAATVRSRLIKNVIRELIKQPERVLFPAGNAR